MKQNQLRCTAGRTWLRIHRLLLRRRIVLLLLCRGCAREPRSTCQRLLLSVRTHASSHGPQVCIHAHIACTARRDPALSMAVTDPRLPQCGSPQASTRTRLPAVHRRRLVAGLRLVALLQGRLVRRPPAMAAPAALCARRRGRRARDAVVRRLIVRACRTKPCVRARAGWHTKQGSMPASSRSRCSPVDKPAAADERADPC